MFSFENYLFALLLVLLPIFVYYSYFYKKELFRGKSFLLGLLCCGSIIFSMSYPVELTTGHLYDLRTIPWLLTFLYCGYRVGIVSTIVIFIYRLVIGFDVGFVITVLAYTASSISVFIFLKSYKKAGLKQRLKISLLLTLLNNLFVIIGILYDFEIITYNEIQSFIAYFIISHLVTILIVVYIIETLQEKEQNKVKIQQSERIKLIGEMAAAVAHEIRNPLTVVKGFMQLFKSDKNLTTKQIGSIELMYSELLRAEKIINDYLSLAKFETTDLDKLDIKETLENVVEVIESYALLNGVTVTNKVQDSFYVAGNRSELSQVFLNIIKNGIESIEDKGDLTISASKTGSHIEVNITDTGKGMSETEIERLGAPFYTTKDQGTGLGTMVCYKIVDNLKGEIKVKSKINEGTTFTIVLPILMRKTAKMI